MGIKVLPTDPKKLLEVFTKDHAKWLKSEPKRSGYNLEEKPKEKKPSGSVGPETISLAIGGPIENPMEKKQKPLYEEELGMYGGGAVRKKVYARGGSTRPTRG